MKISTFTLGILVLGAIAGYAQPVITKQPADQSVSLGAKATFQVTATPSPLTYQWFSGAAELNGATNRLFTVSNAVAGNAGEYFAVVTGDGGSVTSKVARLDVDPTFIKVTTGPIVNDGGFSFSGSWGDYDADGYVDLFVCNWPENSGAQRDFLYRNNRDGTFTSITNVPPVREKRWAAGAAWADYDNDGRLDLFVVRPGVDSAASRTANTLYHSIGGGNFNKVTTGVLVTEPMHAHAGIWGDFDNDGYVDLAVVNFGHSDVQGKETYIPNYLYHNSAGNDFIRSLLAPAKTPNRGDSWNVAAGDFNNDGLLDLVIPQGGTAVSEPTLLYANGAAGLKFITNSVFSSNLVAGVACAWGDYDNDGLLDLFVTTFYGQKNQLFHNDGDGRFTLVTNSIVSQEAATSVGCAWGDYDNDGFLDLFVANLGPVDRTSGASIRSENNFLYHNEGNGTFRKVVTGSPSNDLGYSTGCAWADYDNDGFLDLFVANGWATKSENNFLYHNGGGTNHWLSFELIGGVSNRSAIGTKVRVKTTVNEREMWQLREISGGGNYGSQNDLRAHFGIAASTNVDLVRVEWPSGIVQEFRDIPIDRLHQLREPPVLNIDAKALQLTLRGIVGQEYSVEATSDLKLWSSLGSFVVTSASNPLPLTNNSSNANYSFYRAAAR